MLRFYNSLSNKIEEFKPQDKNNVTIYVCGPTVYNYIHIGNARPVVFYDLVRRYLLFCGYNVKFASNITDIDDKIINKAKELNKSEKEIATFYEEAYFKDTDNLNSLRPDYIPHATSYINDMIDFIKDLIDKGYAYEVDGNVYFRITKIADYGLLSNQDKEALNEGARIEVAQNKENPLDFTLWKKTEVGIKWPSPFGEGRPGWHTECVVMNHKLFGSLIDIHGGGMDLKFPQGVKMSKSLGNFIFVKDFDTPVKMMVLRMILLFSPYRANINYQEELYNQYLSLYDKWLRAFKQSYYFLACNDLLSNEVDNKIITDFKTYMDDDFNVQNVLSLLDDLIKQINQLYRQKDYETLAVKLNTFKTIKEVLGLRFYLVNLDDDLKQIYLNWQTARNNKNFAEADIYRATLVEKGIL